MVNSSEDKTDNMSGNKRTLVAETEPVGQVLGAWVVSELQAQGLIEPDSGDSYRQRWHLANPNG
ncbi:MAG: hypothetical protein C0619_00550 [Desulfuromonas sp.]|jgi:hypothetical protein|nr:MAG: hypothetical protein C0619_00550 [Desulfuromonas sp.]